jgi:hypothetical protein
VRQCSANDVQEIDPSLLLSAPFCHA